MTRISLIRKIQSYNEYVTSNTHNYKESHILTYEDLHDYLDSLVEQYDSEDLELVKAYQDPSYDYPDKLVTEAIRKGGKIYKATSLLLQAKAFSSFSDAQTTKGDMNIKMNKVITGLKWMLALSLLNIAATTNDPTLARRR